MAYGSEDFSRMALAEFPELAEDLKEWSHLLQMGVPHAPIESRSEKHAAVPEGLGQEGKALRVTMIRAAQPGAEPDGRLPARGLTP